MKFKIKTLLILCVFIGASLEACHRNPDILSTEFIQLGEKGMMADQNYFFSSTLDSILVKNLIVDGDLMIRYTDRCMLDVFPLHIESSIPSSDSIKKIDINIPLFENNNQKIEKDAFGIFEQEIPILKDLDVSDGSFISISTPDSLTGGIIAIGLILKKR